MPHNIEQLKWYKEMGVDEIIGEETINHMAAKIKSEPKLASNPVSNQFATPAPVSAKIDTRVLADSADNLAKLQDIVVNFKGLGITKTATNTVFSDGQPQSEIMLIGEAPGADEDKYGIPFCGASGQLLDQMLSYIGLERKKNFYITNTIFWRPPGNRRPTPEELAVCLPFVEKHIELIKPKIIVLVGGTAITSLLGSQDGITKLRGKYLDYQNRYLKHPIKTTAIFHPSYLLRSPGQKRLAWQDLLKLQQYIEQNAIKLA